MYYRFLFCHISIKFHLSILNFILCLLIFKKLYLFLEKRIFVEINICM